MLQDSDTNAADGSVLGGSTQDSDEEQTLQSTKLAPKRKKMKVDDNDLLNIFSKSAKSIDALAANMQVKSNAQQAAQSVTNNDNDDDWLFLRRMYLRLKKVPESSSKDRFKLQFECELLNLCEQSAPNSSRYSFAANTTDISGTSYTTSSHPTSSFALQSNATKATEFIPSGPTSRPSVQLPRFVLPRQQLPKQLIIRPISSFAEQ